MKKHYPARLPPQKRLSDYYAFIARTQQAEVPDEFAPVFQLDLFNAPAFMKREKDHGKAIRNNDGANSGKR